MLDPISTVMLPRCVPALIASIAAFNVVYPVGPLLPAVAVTSTGAEVSSFVIVKTAELGIPSDAPDGLDRSILTVSSPSKTVSGQIGTKNEVLVWPALT